MAKTAFATNNALTKKLYEEKLFRDTIKESYFSKFMGEGSENIVQVNNALTKDQGDNVTFGIRMRLSGDGVTSGMTLEGNEEALTTYDFGVALEQYRHAVRDRGALDRQRAMFSIDSESETALRDWGAEKIDKLCFEALNAAPSKIFYKTSAGVLSTGTAATAKSALTAADSKLTIPMLQNMRTWCLTGGNRSQTPIRPIKVEGKNHYVLLVHPDVAYDIKQDSTYTGYVQYAMERGDSNPLFTGSVAIVDGVVIHSHENMPIATDGGSGSVAWSKAALVGAQALCWAWGQRPKLVQKNFDYDNEHGYAWGLIAGVGAPKFNSVIYGSVGIYLARTNISG